MDDMCVWLGRLLGWLEQCARVPLHFVGTGREYRTAPAPYLELVYLAEGSVSNMRMGDLVTEIPAGHMALHNVHFGNMAPKGQRFVGWCAFLDVAEGKVFKELERAPLIFTAPVERPGLLVDAFRKLQGRSREVGWVPPSYLPAPAPSASRESARAPVVRTTELFLKTALLELVALMLEEAQGAVQDKTVLPESVHRALEFMRTNYEEPALSLADIATAAHLNVHHFGRVFRRHMGTTPMRHLRAIRVSHGRFLLQRTSLRVEEIARSVGYTDVFHFSRVFKQECGRGPRAFRKQCATAGPAPAER